MSIPSGIYTRIKITAPEGGQITSADAIKAIREAYSLTRAHLALLIGVRQKTVEGWELGRKVPEVAWVAIEYKILKEMELDRKTIMDEKYALRIGEALYAEEMPVVDGTTPQKIVDWLLSVAAKENATDIQLDTHDGNGRIRFRTSPSEQFNKITSASADSIRRIAWCIKDLARMDIAQNWRPADGRFSFIWLPLDGSEKTFGARVSFYPGKDDADSKTAIRILRKGQLPS
jgi:type II secretory ATPase GspE/PulE/Tfp pilus assembly ATPase PilB-like protein